MRCIACHTAEGFARLQVNGEAMPQEEVDVISKESVGQDRGLSCDGCHGARADGTFAPLDKNPLRVPKATLCAKCHNAETVVFADFATRGTLVRHAQAELIAGTAGEPASGMSATTSGAHSALPDACVTCHADTVNGTAKHTFQPNVAKCGECHTGLVTFNRTARADYDGDGTTEGIQSEITGLLDRLKTALLADPAMTFANGRFDYAGATDHALNGASAAKKRAVFNWYTVESDGSRGVHNPPRAIQLLQRSYKEVTGVDVPGAVIR
jgi:hypothetical protein